MPCDECNSPKPAFSGDAMLGHARSLFEYHAGQRLNSIRYYVVIYSIFTTAFFNKRAQKPASDQDFILLGALCLVIILVSLCFFLLDIRNAELVESDEMALKELEKAASKNSNLDIDISVKDDSGPNYFEITHRSHEGFKGFLGSKIWQYKLIVLILYIALTLFAVVALIFTWYEYCDFKITSNCLCPWN